MMLSRLQIFIKTQESIKGILKIILDDISLKLKNTIYAIFNYTAGLLNLKLHDTNLLMSASDVQV